MKKLFISLVTCFAALSFAQDVPSDDQQAIAALDTQMETLINALNTSDGSALSSIIGTNATEAIKGVPVRLTGNKIEYTIIGNPTYEPIDDTHVKSTWKVSSESTGVNGNVSIAGFSHNAVFEKQGDTWKIVDGSFDPTSMGSVGWVIGLVFGIGALVFIPLGILWILMLIHAAKHDIHNKTTWIILMCLIGLPVSIIYFFTERKRFNTSVIPNSIPSTTVVSTN